MNTELLAQVIYEQGRLWGAEDDEAGVSFVAVTVIEHIADRDRFETAAWALRFELGLDEDPEQWAALCDGPEPDQAAIEEVLLEAIRAALRLCGD